MYSKHRLNDGFQWWRRFATWENLNLFGSKECDKNIRQAKDAMVCDKDPRWKKRHSTTTKPYPSKLGSYMDQITPDCSIINHIWIQLIDL